MEKFYFNPISVDEKIIQFFPNVETLNLYTPYDRMFFSGRIQKFLVWNEIFNKTLTGSVLF